MISCISLFSIDSINLTATLNKKINHVDDILVNDKVNNLFSRIIFLQKKLSRFGLRNQISHYIISILDNYRSYLFDDIPNSYNEDEKQAFITIKIESIDDILEVFVYKFLGIKVICDISHLPHLVEKLNFENSTVVKQLKEHLRIISENPSHHNIFIILEILNTLHSFHCRSAVTAFVSILNNIYDSDFTNIIDYEWMISNLDDSVEFYFDEIIPFLKDDCIDVDKSCFKMTLFEKFDCIEFFNEEMIKTKLLYINTTKESDSKRTYNEINKSLLAISEELINCNNRKLISLFEVHSKLIHNLMGHNL